jgi:soluble lytic murein transglycosylase-like protein
MLDSWKKVEAVLQEALDRPAHERSRFLEQADLNEELRIEAASLIAAHESAGDFIEQPALVLDAHVILDHRAAKNIGAEIGPYRILQFLGAGGMGEVYLAEDNRLKRRLALKLLPAYFAADDERLARFQREAQTASALNHPNILTIHEVGESEGVRFIATEFIDGETIQELISKQQLALAEILDIATQVVSGLAAAHAAGIVHRDIKPDNIMRRHDGLVKLLDFGVAKLLEPAAESERDSELMQTEMGTLVGTVSYMSPEQARGLAIDERTDIWSVGVVLYRMLTDRLPFTGATRMDTLVDILEHEPLPLLPVGADGSPELQSLVELVGKTMRKNRNDRFQTALELQNDLKRVRQAFANGGIGNEETFAEVLSRSAAARFGAASVKTKKAPSLLVFLALGFAVLLAVVIAAAFAYRNLLNPRVAERNQAAPVTSSEKVYGEMTDAEQLAFIDAQEQRISTMMGDRPAKLDNDALRAIKRHVDYYVNRSGSASDTENSERLHLIYARAHPYLPIIARSFAARKVPVIIGIYLPMIESAYRPCYENSVGAKGLFQFLPETARRYGVAPDAMCDVEQTAPAAAHYIADHMAELGDDAESMTLVLLSYNTGSSWVRGSLRELRDSDDYERTFWMLFRNRDRLGESFSNEGAGYVPMFFAAAIIGENPRNFGLKMEPLSTLTGVGDLTTLSKPN